MSVTLESVERECRAEAESRAKHEAWTRELIATARDLDAPWEAIADWLGLSRSTVIRIHQKDSPRD